MQYYGSIFRVVTWLPSEVLHARKHNGGMSNPLVVRDGFGPDAGQFVNFNSSARLR